MTTINATIPINDADMAMLCAYEADVVARCSPVFAANVHRFTGAARLMARFEDAMTAVYRYGRGQFHAAHEAHNELCASIALLDEPAVAAVAYEPPLRGTNQTIDFVVTDGSGSSAYVDVKTIRPKRTDKWQQFERVQDSGKLADNTEVVLHRHWLGGELWHDMYASRGRMLEYTLEFEAKLRAAGLSAAHTTLMFCGEGGTWYNDELQEFAEFYRNGEHVAGDALGKMEAWVVRQQSLVFDRSITAFASMRRDEFDMNVERILWNVG
jgi:hypothetical protein